MMLCFPSWENNVQLATSMLTYAHSGPGGQILWQIIQFQQEIIKLNGSEGSKGYHLCQLIFLFPLSLAGCGCLWICHYDQQNLKILMWHSDAIAWPQGVVRVPKP